MSNHIKYTIYIGDNTVFPLATQVASSALGFATKITFNDRMDNYTEIITHETILIQRESDT
jgi:hypothetical protein